MKGQPWWPFALNTSEHLDPWDMPRDKHCMIASCHAIRWSYHVMSCEPCLLTSVLQSITSHRSTTYHTVHSFHTNITIWEWHSQVFKKWGCFCTKRCLINPLLETKDDPFNTKYFGKTVRIRITHMISGFAPIVVFTTWPIGSVFKYSKSSRFPDNSRQCIRKTSSRIFLQNHIHFSTKFPAAFHMHKSSKLKLVDGGFLGTLSKKYSDSSSNHVS